MTIGASDQGRAPGQDRAPVVVLFHRDLRVHDHPGLTAAARSGASVIPLFVIDGNLVSAPRSGNRVAFMLEALHDLRRSLERRGGQLLVRSGDPIDEVMTVVSETGARTVHVSDDVTATARRRLERLGKACRVNRVRLDVFPGTTAVPAGELRPEGADHYRVFTPYWRRWSRHPWRELAAAPVRVHTPRGLPLGRIPGLRSLNGGPVSPNRARGGEEVARRMAKRWLDHRLPAYPEAHDDLAADGTSRLSPYLHFGCLSVNELACRAEGRPGAEAFIRQLCWRDFHHQVLAAFPALSERDYRPRPGRRWLEDGAVVEAWKEGRTGIAVVDAAMRQLLDEGWMPNRARLLTASYLTRQRGVHWRPGAEHFMDWLVDADVANNYGNWQWVAGTGNDTRPNRRFNLLRQASRFDPEGDYVRRHVPELAGTPGPAVHRLDADPAASGGAFQPSPRASPSRSASASRRTTAWM